MKLIWREKLGKPECPYIERWVLDFGVFSLRLHHWLSSDDQRHFHDHPWWFFTIILAGGYTDISPSVREKMIPGRFKLRSAFHQHTVKVDRGGCWSFLVTGPENRVWGFWVDGRFRKRNKYFFEKGHHQCDK